MAFIKTDSFDVVRLSRSVAWIGGLQLAPSDSGTIGFSGSELDPEVLLPEGFGPPEGGNTLLAAVRVNAIANSAGPLTNLPLSVGKDGEGVEDFTITLTNTNTGLTTQVFEVYVELISDGNPASGSCVTVNVSCAH